LVIIHRNNEMLASSSSDWMTRWIMVSRSSAAFVGDNPFKATGAEANIEAEVKTGKVPPENFKLNGKLYDKGE
jgi:hypothetical protein